MKNGISVDEVARLARMYGNSVLPSFADLLRQFRCMYARSPHRIAWGRDRQEARIASWEMGSDPGKARARESAVARVGSSAQTNEKAMHIMLSCVSGSRSPDDRCYVHKR